MSDQRRDQLLSHLADCNLPGELVAWLRHGFEVHAAGGCLLTALGLAGPDLNRRDSLLREVLALSPGESVTARCAFVIGCLADEEQHPRPDMQRTIEALQRLGGALSVRQLRRIIAGRRQDGWRDVR